MKLTTKGRYAVMAMADLALFQSGKPVSLNEISLRQNISLSYLEQLFAKLKNVKLVKSIRGPSGGYILEKNPKDIKLSNIIFAVDEKVKTLNCNKESKKGCNGEKDELVSKESIIDLNNRLKSQKGIDVLFSEIKGANHFFKDREEDLKKIIDKYIKDKTKLI